ncbi:hypothetical protein DPMN_103095 [Dreissena polymorpha]|uniref:Uncharacterized protein n=1 Tax=Dreissena polymorpha TaxID=45954 RepID=A0A9D4JYV9_DREPO|nr:hypothetical protein DPMN_103095 [Dreissena polymorpha]
MAIGFRQDRIDSTVIDHTDRSKGRTIVRLLDRGKALSRKDNRGMTNSAVVE